MLPTEHESQYFDFCNPYNEKRPIFAGILPAHQPDLADLLLSGRNGTWMAGPDPPTTRAGGQDDVSYNKLPLITPALDPKQFWSHSESY